jgi:hypothetical protein
MLVLWRKAQEGGQGEEREEGARIQTHHKTPDKTIGWIVFESGRKQKKGERVRGEERRREGAIVTMRLPPMTMPQRSLLKFCKGRKGMKRKKYRKEGRERGRR